MPTKRLLKCEPLNFGLPMQMAGSHRRAKTDRLDTELLKRAFLGWMRGEPDHCSMAMIPTIAEKVARRPNRERENLVGQRTRIVNRMKECLEDQPD